MSLKFVRKGPIDNKSVLVEVLVGTIYDTAEAAKHQNGENRFSEPLFSSGEGTVTVGCLFCTVQVKKQHGCDQADGASPVLSLIPRNGGHFVWGWVGVGVGVGGGGGGVS